MILAQKTRFVAHLKEWYVMSSVDRFHSIGTLNRNSADATSQTTVSE